MGLLGPELFFLIRELPVCLDVCHWHKENVRDSGGECGMHTNKEVVFLSGSWFSGESPHALSPTLFLQSGKFSSSSPAPLSPPQGLSYAEDATEHENMKAVLKTSSPALEDATPVLGVRTRSRASRGDSWQGGDLGEGSPSWWCR